MDAALDVGLISQQDFNAAVRWFAEKSELLEDGWTISDDAGGQPTLKRVSSRQLRVPNHRNNCQTMYELESTELCQATSEDDWSQSDDIGEISEPNVTCDDSSTLTCRVEHHIVYSYSYCVPLIYFNVYKPGGELVSLEELWYNIRSVVDIKENMWSVVTQQEHPSLRRPFYYLHPCHTADILKQLHPACKTTDSASLKCTCTVQNTVNDSSDCHDREHCASCSVHKESYTVSPRLYFLTWLSSIAPMVMLELSHQYAKFT